MPTRPRVAGRQRRVYALVASLPYSGAQTAFFSLDMTIESFLEGHVRAFEWLGGVPRECVYDNLRSVVARREGERGDLESALPAPARPLRLPRDRVHAGDAAREGLGRSGRALPQERLLAGAALRLARRARRAVRRLARPVCNRAARDRPLPGRRAARRGAPAPCGRSRPRASTGRARARSACRSTATCATAAASTGRRSGSCTSGSSCASTATRSGSCHRGAEVARYPRSYEQGVWLPPPIMRAEPPPRRRPPSLPRPTVAPPELADYAELCA